MKQAGSFVLSALLAVSCSCSLQVGMLVQLASSIVKYSFVKENKQPCLYTAVCHDFMTLQRHMLIPILKKPYTPSPASPRIPWDKESSCTERTKDKETVTTLYISDNTKILTWYN
jgi:hypothetical protein